MLFRSKIKALSTLTVLGTVVLSSGAFSHIDLAPKPLDLMNLQVFAKRSIEAERSDYEGPAAAGGTIKLTDFEVDGDLTSGMRVDFSKGIVKGFVVSPTSKLTNVFASGNKLNVPLAIELATTKLNMIAARLSSLPVTAKASIHKGALFGNTFDVITIAAKQDLVVVELTADQLVSDAPGHLKLVLQGNAKARILVRVRGSVVRVRDVGFSVVGGINPSQIVFYFPDALDLEVSSSGGARGPGGEAWDIPGTIIAPDASLRFASATVTGQVLVDRVLPISGQPSGQVNRFVLPGSGQPGGEADIAVPSQFLSLVASNQFEFPLSGGTYQAQASSQVSNPTERAAPFGSTLHPMCVPGCR